MVNLIKHKKLATSKDGGNGVTLVTHQDQNALGRLTALYRGNTGRLWTAIWLLTGSGLMNLAQAATVSFTVPGLAIWQVPPHVASLNVVVTGGAGGAGGGDNYGLSGSGGRGAQVTSRLAVTPLETLRLRVGGAGFTGNSMIRGLSGAGFGGGGGGGHSRITGMQGEVVAGGGGGGGGGGGSSRFNRGFSGSPGDSGGIPDGDGGGGGGGGGGVSGSNGIPGEMGMIGLNGDGGGGGGGGGGGDGPGGNISGGGGSGGDGGSSSGPAGSTTYTIATYSKNPRHGSITLSYYTLSYASNGGSGTAPTPVGYGSDVLVTAANSALFTRPGYTLVGWSTQPSGKGVTYTPDQPFAMPAQDLILYAQWIPATTANEATTP